MCRWIKWSCFILLQFVLLNAFAQNIRPAYHPCFLLDSVDAKLDFIRINAAKVFTDTFDCKQMLMDSIGARYLATKSNRYLDVLTAIHQNPAASEKVENLYIDVIKRFAEDDFAGFINRIYLAKGRYTPLEKELIATLNMIVNGRPYKQKYMGLLNVEIGKAKDAGDKYKLAYLQKLKLKIDEESYRSDCRFNRAANVIIVKFNIFGSQFLLIVKRGAIIISASLFTLTLFE